MKIELRTETNGPVVFECEAGSLQEAVELATAAGVKGKPTVMETSRLTISPIAAAVEPLPAKLDSPYTLAQIMANLETMRAGECSLTWCQRFAASVIERGIDAIPTTPGETPYFAKLVRDNAAMLAACKSIVKLYEDNPCMPYGGICDNLKQVVLAAESGE